MTAAVLLMVAASCASGSDGQATSDIAEATGSAQDDEATVGDDGAEPLSVARSGGIGSAAATPGAAQDPAAAALVVVDDTAASGAANGDSTSSTSAAPSSSTEAMGTSTTTSTNDSTSTSTSTSTSAATATSATQGHRTTPTTQRRTTTTEATTTTARSEGSGRFATLPPGSSLPSGEWCAARVKSRPETRSGNAAYNARRGNSSNDWNPRVDGDFVGTTDEIIQWAACKWGIDEDWARAQSAKESWWDMTTGGDRTSDQSACHPDLRTGSGDCPESIGLLQVRFLYHGEAFENSNAIRSTAYNADYTYAVWRSCYEGNEGWLNDVERGATYSAGDLEGCLGVWFSGRWYVPEAVTYIADVRQLKNSRIWEQPDFIDYE